MYLAVKERNKLTVVEYAGGTAQIAIHTMNLRIWIRITQTLPNQPTSLELPSKDEKEVAFAER